jgi:hypothetical protein
MSPRRPRKPKAAPLIPATPRAPRRIGQRGTLTVAAGVPKTVEDPDLSTAGAVADSGDTQREFGDVLARAKRRFRKAADSDQNARLEGLKALQFYTGDQWEDGIRNERFNSGRPMLTIDRIMPTVHLVCNEFRNQRPAVQVNPVGSGADIAVADIMEGIVRHIETQSDAEIAYDHAQEMMVAIGRGSLRIITEWASDEMDESAFHQELRIKRIMNPFSVYWDPSATEPDRSDALFCFITEDMDRDEYRAQYEKTSLASLSDFHGVGDESYWFPEGDKIRLAEYFEVEITPQKIALLGDGSVVPIEETTAQDAIVKTRTLNRKSIHWYKLNAVEVLEQEAMPGEFIPVVTMWGGEYMVKDKKKIMGLVQTMMDAQRQYNVMRSAAVETALLTSRAPWLVTTAMIENFEQEWKQANIRNLPYLKYNAVAGPNGIPVGPPIRNQWEPPIQAFSILISQADNDIKATSGVYDASMGRPGPDRSGKAITAQQQAGATATFHFADNGARGVRQTGRILVSMMPRVYDAPRVVRIVKPDGDAQMVPVNQHFVPTRTQQGHPSYRTLTKQQLEQTQPGLAKFYDLTVGKYDVTVQMGPSFQTRRQEAFSDLIDLVKGFPQIMQVAGDVIMANWDAPFAQELAKRLKLMLPPAIQQAEALQDGTRAPIDPSVVAQQQAVIQQLTAQLQALAQVIRQKKLEADSKEKVALTNAIAGIIEAQIKAGTQSAQGLANMNLDMAKSMADTILQVWQAEREDAQMAAGQPPTGAVPPLPNPPAQLGA